MNIRLINETFTINRPVVTIGIFDGVHRGHQFILSQLQEHAHRHGGESVVVTLWPHPRIVLNKDVWNFKLLHSREEKIRQLERRGVHHLIFIPFTLEIASLTACDFVQKYLVDRIGLDVLLLGHDNRFGRDQKGDPEGLARCAGQNKFRIEKLPEFNQGEMSINSTAIRNHILKGDLESAQKLLGENYSITGTVVEGNRIGRQIGFPTANIHPLDAYKLIPLNGVYAVMVELNGKQYKGMLNIGFRPTMDSASAVKTIEAHLFDASGDFYGEEIIIHFIKRIRDEMKFTSIEALKEQLKKDKVSIKKIF